VVNTGTETITATTQDGNKTASCKTHLVHSAIGTNTGIHCFEILTTPSQVFNVGERCSHLNNASTSIKISICLKTLSTSGLYSTSQNTKSQIKMYPRKRIAGVFKTLHFGQVDF
jgi:hypothetical protein